MHLCLYIFSEAKRISAAECDVNNKKNQLAATLKCIYSFFFCYCHNSARGGVEAVVASEESGGALPRGFAGVVEALHWRRQAQAINMAGERDGGCGTIGLGGRDQCI